MASQPAGFSAAEYSSEAQGHRALGYKGKWGPKTDSYPGTRLAPTQGCSWAERAQAETHSQRQWAGGWASPLLAQMLALLPRKVPGRTWGPEREEGES